MAILQGILALIFFGALGSIFFWKGRRWQALFVLVITLVAFSYVEGHRLKNDPEYAAQKAAEARKAEQQKLADAEAERTAERVAAVSLVNRRPTAPNYSTVLSRLGDRYTESQRQDYFDKFVKGKIASWPLIVDDVQRKTFGGMQVIGKKGNWDQVVCIVADAYEDQARSLSKGQRFTCVGEIENYVKLGVSTIRISNAGLK